MKTLLAVVAILTFALQPLRAADAPGPVIGIGTQLKSVGGLPVVVSVLPGSPADKAGVKAEDKLMKIDNKLVAGQSLHEIAHRLRGDRNSEVRVTVERHGSQRNFEMKREILIMPGAPQP